MCQIGTLNITAWHPIKYNGEWNHPNNIITPTLTQCESMYTFLLDWGHIAVINDIEVIMLAHNYTDGVLEHEYYGTENVIKDMKMMPGWAFGHIVINDNVLYIRNSENGLVKNICFQNFVSVEC